MAADVQDRVPIFDYDVISIGGPEDPPEPGDHWDEDVYEARPPRGGKERGETQIGKVEIHAKGPREEPRLDAFFTFTNPRCEIKVDGKVPGGPRWRGEGQAFAEGCGRKRKPIDIEFWNPKRW